MPNFAVIYNATVPNNNAIQCNNIAQRQHKEKQC